nr:hypothetical protein [Tanacetum cinerariifolium]
MYRRRQPTPPRQPPFHPAATTTYNTTTAATLPPPLFVHDKADTTTTVTATAFPAAIAAVGLSTAKPTSWWRSDDGTATTAAPCGVGLWRRNPYGCLAEISHLTPPLWRRPSRLWPQQPPQPHHGGVGLVVVIPHLLN